MSSVHGPCVRSACEPCRDRKQRCHIPDSGGSCQACANAQRNCYFVPRFKAGRPKRSQSTQDGGLAHAPPTSPLSSSSSRHSTTTIPMPLEQQQPHHDPPFGMASPFIDASAIDIGTNEFGNLMDGFEGFDYFDYFSNPMGQSAASSSSGRASFSGMSPQQSSASYFAPRAEPFPSMPIQDPVQLLTQRFVDLHQHSEMLKHGLLSKAYILDSNGSVAASISAMINHTVNMLSGNKALNAEDALLIQAGIAKACGLCESIVLVSEQRSGLSPTNSSRSSPSQSPRGDSGSTGGSDAGSLHVGMDFVTLLENTDISLSRARTCLAQLARSRQCPGGLDDTIQRCVSLRQRISLLMERVCL